MTPENIVVVANKMAWHSVELAKYYMEKRHIPSNNLILLNTSSEEECSRNDFEKYIAAPIRTFLKKNDPEGNKFLCLVTMYGLPLRVRPPELTGQEKKSYRVYKNNTMPFVTGS
ncbi:MAG: TIGR03790 family protein [Deltaproteobacteria bacterium]|nr:TIGR03790 family protein [Deltaproteobacteria bacterium]